MDFTFNGCSKSPNEILKDNKSNIDDWLSIFENIDTTNMRKTKKDFSRKILI